VEAMKKILVIDDYLNTREVMVDFLSKTGDYKFFQASDGKEGIKMFDSWCPDIVIIDLGIGGIRGEEIVRLIKKNPQNKTKVIVLGSRDDLDREPMAKAAGCDIFLKKPFHLLKLQEAVGRLFKNNCREIFTCR